MKRLKQLFCGRRNRRSSTEQQQQSKSTETETLRDQTLPPIIDTQPQAPVDADARRSSKGSGNDSSQDSLRRRSSSDHRRASNSTDSSHGTSTTTATTTSPSPTARLRMPPSTLSPSPLSRAVFASTNSTLSTTSMPSPRSPIPYMAINSTAINSAPVNSTPTASFPSSSIPTTMHATPHNPPSNPYGANIPLQPLSPRALERRRQQQLLLPSPPIGHAHDNDPFVHIAALHEHLQDLDVLNYTNLRSLLESKLGKAAHLSQSEMQAFRKLVGELGEAYRQFLASTSACVRFKLDHVEGEAVVVDVVEKMDHVEGEAVMTVKADTASDAVASGIVSVGSEVTKTEKQVPSRVEKQVPVKDVQVVPLDTTNIDPVISSALETTNNAGSIVTDAVDLPAPPPATLPVLSPIVTDTPPQYPFLEQPEFRSCFEQLRTHYKAILQHMETVEQMIQRNRCCIDPGAILLANSDVGDLRRYFVHTKYKEMVKGCGANRTQYTSLWAGTDQPGDRWMNDLLKCYWRELDGDEMELEWMQLRAKRKRRQNTSATAQTSAGSLPRSTSRSSGGSGDKSLRSRQNDDAEEEETDWLASEMMRRLDLMSVRASNPYVLDLIAMQRVIAWMKQVHRSPHLHSQNTRETIDNAAEKMGGWKHLDAFCWNWLRQFYLQTSKKGIPYPLPGCTSWLPDVDCTADRRFGSSPLSMSLAELNRLQVVPPSSPVRSSFLPGKSQPSHQSKTRNIPLFLPPDFPLLGDAEPRQDQKYWDYIWVSVCRTLLEVHELVEEELKGAHGIAQWMADVEATGLLSEGEYLIPLFGTNTAEDQTYYGESMSNRKKNLLHPGIVRIRERGIVINACFHPQRIRYLHQVDQEIRQEFGNKVPLLEAVGQKILHRSQERLPMVESGLVGDMPVPPSTSSGGSSSGNPTRKSHRKSYSTGGVLDRRQSRHSKKNSLLAMLGEGKGKDGEDAESDKMHRSANALAPASPQANVSTGSLPSSPVDETLAKRRQRDRTRSAPPMPFEAWQPQGSGGFTNLYLEIQRICRLITTKANLPPIDLLERAFEMSEVVVKHYLTQELPAKYQSAY